MFFNYVESYQFPRSFSFLLPPLRVSPWPGGEGCGSLPGMRPGAPCVLGVQPPQGPPTRRGTAVLARQEPTGALDPRAVGKGLLASAAGCGEPRAQLERVQPQPSLTLPRSAPHHPVAFSAEAKLVAKVASLTSDPCYTKPNHFLAQGAFPSCVIQCSWSSFPTRQQHQLQLLISSGCNLGWSQARGSC